MSLQCDIKNPLKRDGTSQEKRELDALKPENTPIDNRSRADLLEFARSYAGLVQFYDSSNQRLGNWQTFFEEDIDESEPHMALFCTFLELFAKAQDHLNQLTADHLDFYYKEVLNIAKKAAAPDKAHVVFELAKNVSTHKLEADTALSAGKDDTKVEVLFTTNKEIVVNTTTAETFKTVYVAELTEDDETYIAGVFASPVANSSDGEGTAFEEESDSWPTFGETQLGLSAADRTMPDGDVGFAIASPVLRMAEGERTLTITITSGSSIDSNINEKITAGLACYLSGEEGWLEPDTLVPQNDDISEYQFIFVATLSASAAAVVDYDEEIFGEGYATNWPLVKLVCKPGASDYALRFLKSIVVHQVDLKVEVAGMKGLVLQSGAALLDPNAPFLPFGPQPSLGSRLLIGNAEALRKKLTSLSVHIDWHDLPNENMATHYAGYGSPAPANNQFRVQPYMRFKRGWYATGVERKLFKSAGASMHREIAVGLESSYTLSTGASADYDRSLSYAEINEFSHTVEDGFLALELVGPSTPFKAFGHKEYPRLLTTRAIAAATGETGASTADIPEAPYTPIIKELSLTYSSQASLYFAAEGPEPGDASAYEDRVEQFFHLRPFGNEEQHPYFAKSVNIFLMPQFMGEGTLYIGLENLEPGQNVSLLFQVAEGTADPSASKETIAWAYLTAKGWVSFSNDQVLSDSTNELLTSGIITFATQKKMVDNNPNLPAGKYWIRGVTNNAEAHAQVISVHTQAVTVSFADNGNDPARLAEALLAGSIKKLATAQSQIKKVSQPYASFGGRTKEEDQDYYTRVSERLRHKQRAVTIWDYEHLVLQQFPSVYKVKCINHTNDTSEYAPGQVKLVVVSNLRNQNAVNPLQPLTSINTLDEIQTYVDAISTTFVTPIVSNPDFEQVRVRFKVRFYDTVDAGYYAKQLPTDINTFLSPWAYAEGKDIVFQGRIHKSMILNFVEELWYVDYVSCFEMDQITDAGDLTNVEEAQATHAAAILVADAEANHTITVLTTDDCACASGDADGGDVDGGDADGGSGGGGSGGLEGIDYWAVEDDFVVS